MNFLQKLRTNTGKLLVGDSLDINKANLSSIKQSVGVVRTDNSSEMVKQAIYPQWFFSANLGQPRNFDPSILRLLSRSSWIQMVLNTFKKEISTIEWRVVPEDEEEEVDRTQDIKIVNDKLWNINSNNQCVNDINSEAITDIAEIDAGVLNYVYSMDSYTIGDVPVYNNLGQEVDTIPGLILKPLGQRTFMQLKSVDGASMLQQVDIYKNLLRYYQWSFKHPNKGPIQFEKDEIAYLKMNSKSYDIYGFSPVQAIQQEVEVLMQGTRYNKDLYKNNAVPDQIVSLPKVPVPELNKVKRQWNDNYQGKPHQVGFINWPIDNIYKLASSNRDLEWLDGQNWYFRIVFAAFGVSPTEAGFFENANKSNDEGQARVTVRNALKPYMALLERIHTNKTITEILQREDHGLVFKFFPVDHSEEKLKFEQSMKELEVGAMTINEYRSMNGMSEVEWGDEPLRRPFDPSSSFSNFGGSGNNQNQNNNNPNIDNMNEEEQKMLREKLYKKDFEVFMHDRSTNRRAIARNTSK